MPTVGVNSLATASGLVDKVVTVCEESIALAILRLIEVCCSQIFCMLVLVFIGKFHLRFSSVYAGNVLPNIAIICVVTI